MRFVASIAVALVAFVCAQADAKAGIPGGRKQHTHTHTHTHLAYLMTETLDLKAKYRPFWCKLIPFLFPPPCCVCTGLSKAYEPTPKYRDVGKPQAAPKLRHRLSDRWHAGK